MSKVAGAELGGANEAQRGEPVVVCWAATGHVLWPHITCDDGHMNTRRWPQEHAAHTEVI